MAALFVLSGGLVAGTASSASALDSACSQSGSTVTCTYSYTGAEQTFAVPDGVTVVQVSATGAAGGRGYDQSGSVSIAGGSGAAASATLGVSSGSTLYVEVGGAGEDGTPRATAAGTRAFNGGGPAPANGAGSGGVGGGGGGASDVRTTSNQLGIDSLSTRLLVGGGGGGAGGSAFDLTRGGTLAAGGAAGAAGANGSRSGNDQATGGQPGTDSSAGAGGTSFVANGGDGSNDTGGAGATYGGGGGGGLWGGGGGAAHNYGAGGGGGSSYAPDGTVALSGSAASVVISYTFGPDGAPTISDVAPDYSPAAGGASVVLTGSAFTGATAVQFGDAAATSFTIDSDTQITAVTPPHAQGLAPLTVTGPGGTSTAVAFTYQPPTPNVTGVNPPHGPTSGGTTIVLSGTHFTGATAVEFGSEPATSFTVDSDIQITAVDPAGPSGSAPVTVTGPGGASTPAPFSYDYPAPVVTNVDPASGPSAGGTTVTITGTGFTTTSEVTFGDSTNATNAASYTVDSDTQITAVTPAHFGGAYPVNVGSAGGNSVANQSSTFTFVAPATIDYVEPSSGPTAGGTTVTIAGSGFTGATAVTFGTVEATSFTVNSDRSITAVTPAEPAAVIVVTITVPAGTSDATGRGEFTYAAPPVITALDPSGGSTAGGTDVVISGSGFSNASAVTFDGVAAESYFVNGDGHIGAVSPPHALGDVSVVVKTPYGTSNSATFTYADAPTVTAISPKTGPVAGGQKVTITGTGFFSGATVKFAKKKTSFAATDVVVVSDSEITAVTPSVPTKGSYAVQVTTAAGQNHPGRGAKYRFVTTPAVTSVAPDSGPITGGTSITITGYGFTAGATVLVGSVPATSVTVVSATQITAKTPAEPKAKTYDVRVTTAAGESHTNTGDQFTATLSGSTTRRFE